MKTLVRVAVAALAAVLLLGAGPLTAPRPGHPDVRVAGGDVPDGG